VRLDSRLSLISLERLGALGPAVRSSVDGGCARGGGGGDGDGDGGGRDGSGQRQRRRQEEGGVHDCYEREKYRPLRVHKRGHSESE
jgi:hypothetical protein